MATPRRRTASGESPVSLRSPSETLPDAERAHGQGQVVAEGEDDDGRHHGHADADAARRPDPAPGRPVHLVRGVPGQAAADRAHDEQEWHGDGEQGQEGGDDGEHAHR